MNRMIGACCNERARAQLSIHNESWASCEFRVVAAGLTLHDVFTHLHDIEREIVGASKLDDALAVLVRWVTEPLSVDVFAVYLAGAETGRFVLRASDRAIPEGQQQVLAATSAGLVGLVAERQRQLELNDAPDHPRYSPAVETGGRSLDGFLGIPLIHL